MNTYEIFTNAGLTICGWDDQQEEFFPLSKQDHEIIFNVLIDTDRLSATEKTLILAGTTICPTIEGK